MTHLIHGRQVDRYFSGRLGADQSQALLARLWRCAPCRERYQRHLLFERVLPDGASRRDGRLWQTILGSAGAAGATEKGRSERPVRGRSLLLGASFALALVALIPLSPLWPRSRGGGDPVARGALSGASSAPSLHLYRSVGGKTEPLGRELNGGDGILIAYSNPSAELRHLMVFAVDQRGDIHWYYPAYERLGEDPAAIPIRTGAFGVELGEEIRHPLPPGALRIFALFLPEPMHVLGIETLMRTELARHGGAVEEVSSVGPVPGEQTTTLLRVRP